MFRHVDGLVSRLVSRLVAVDHEPVGFHSAPESRTPHTQGSRDEKHKRWDDQDIYAFEGTYGEYILGKASKVFPELGRTVT
jgi:hypothetical protein